jgi:hypothetical protein
VISNLVLVSSSKKCVVALALNVLLALALFQSVNGEPVSVWHLRYLGESSKPRDVLIAPNAFKIANGSGNTLISKAPKWDACIFNSETKKIMRIPFATWKKSGLGILESEAEPFSPDQKISGIARVQELPSVHYSSKTKVSDGFYRMRSKPREAAVDYYGTSAITLSDIQRELFCFWFGVPLTKELPLVWVFSFADGEKNYPLKIVWHLREPYNAHAFDEPINYALAHNTREVYMKNMSNLIEQEFIDGK